MAEDTETRPASAGAEEREEGEIADDGDGSSAAAGRGTGAISAHPLENAWTFWFDNPQGKSRQVTWGSTIHPIHTFSTVEDFWGQTFSSKHRGHVAGTQEASLMENWLASFLSGGNKDSHVYYYIDR